MLRENITTLYIPISISGILKAYINGLADINGKWGTGRDWRAR